MKKNFNQSEYIKQYNKDHYLTFKVDLKKEEKLELDELLKKSNLTKAQFLKNAIDELRNKSTKKELGN